MMRYLAYVLGGVTAYLLGSIVGHLVRAWLGI